MKRKSASRRRSADRLSLPDSAGERPALLSFILRRTTRFPSSAPAMNSLSTPRPRPLARRAKTRGRLPGEHALMTPPLCRVKFALNPAFAKWAFRATALGPTPQGKRLTTVEVNSRQNSTGSRRFPPSRTRQGQSKNALCHQNRRIDTGGGIRAAWREIRFSPLFSPSPGGNRRVAKGLPRSLPSPSSPRTIRWRCSSTRAERP